VFVSYHHGNDRSYYDQFCAHFCDTYELIRDNSVEREIDSDNADYVIRRIRENYITGSSCTVVLCGAQTSGRKFVDWEIKATLDAMHGLLGVRLPTISRAGLFGYDVWPARFQDNLDSNYAFTADWGALMVEPGRLRGFVELANHRNCLLIDNSRDLRRRNG
jgi:Thoeris protein ThsB, TIR-like domain